MKKVTVTLPQGQWGTLKTKYPRNSDQVKFNEFTGTSKNFDTDASGVITKRPGSIAYNSSLVANAPQDTYEAIFSTGSHHLLEVDGGTLRYSAGGGIMNDVTAGYTSTGNFEFALYQNRVYFGNGIDSPQVYDTTTSYGGVSYVAPKTKVAGAQTPTTPTVALVSDSTANQVPAGAHTYKVTYLYYGSEESNGSSASSVVTADGTHTQVTVTIPVGGYGVTARKIYRDANDGNWLLITTVSDNTTTSYADKSSTGTSPIPTDNGLPPTFSKVIQHLDRLWAAGVSSNTSYLYFSQPGSPDLWSATGFILCNPRDPIMGLAVYNDTVMVFNRNSLGQILGSDSSTFRYSEVPSSIGCVDNRSIQIRTSSGVPTIMWLSDKGFYEFNGSSIDYVSEPIEDQVNLNIQQASQVKGKNAQDTQADFQGGTATAGIVLTSSGLITQTNPKQSYQVEADYTTGTTSSMALHSTGNVLKAVVANSYSLAAGTLNALNISGSSLVTPTSTDFTGESHLSTVRFTQSPNATDAFAQSVLLPRAGTLSNFTVSVLGSSVGGSTPNLVYQCKVWRDAGGFPGTEAYSGSTFQQPGTVATSSNHTESSVNVSVGVNEKVWIGVAIVSGGSGNNNGIPTGNENQNFASQTALCRASGLWASYSCFTSSTVPVKSLPMSYTYVSTANPASGSWISATYDTQSDGAFPTTFIGVGSFPTGTSTSILLEGSNDQASWDISLAYANLNSTQTVSTSNRRYWRVRALLTTSDDRNTPSTGSFSIQFPTTATWTSAAIDHTTDITALNSLTSSSSVPAGTTATVQIATSSDNITYSSFVAVGSATPARYSKVKVTITTDASDATTATVNNVVLSWTVVSTLVSSAIDTSNTPVGWELFQSTFGTTGAVAFKVRTATTSGGLSGATWITTTNGAFITNTVNRWIQWEAILTATADNVPSVDSVTINWFISKTNSIRVTSLFYGRAYYLAAAEFGNATNNIIFKYDPQNNWRVYRGQGVGTMTFFFNEPYYSSASTGQIYKWLTNTSDAGSSIAMDVQTAAINYEDQEHSKILRKVYVVGKNTGATYTPQYSTDNGLTWKALLDPLTGSSTFTVASDAGLFVKRLVPQFSADNATGHTHIFRLQNNDTFACEIHNIKFEAWVRQGEPNV